MTRRSIFAPRVLIGARRVSFRAMPTPAAPPSASAPSSVAAAPPGRRDPRDAIRSALGESDPITSLRALAIDLAGLGYGQAELENAYGEVASELNDAGREEEAGFVIEVLDMMAEWYADGREID